MIFDIDKKNNNFKIMNILQLKWILYNQIQKKYYNKILNKIKIKIKNIQFNIMIFDIDKKNINLIIIIFKYL